MRNRIAVVAAMALMALCLLVLPGCFVRVNITNGNPEAPKTSEPRGSNQTTTVRDYLAEYDDDGLISSFEDGSGAPVRLHYYAANACEFDIEDADEAAEILATLLAEQIKLNPLDIEIDDGTVIFQFFWEDGSSYIVSFCTSSYFSGKDGYLYPLCGGSQVGDLMNSLFFRSLNEGSSAELDGDRIDFDGRTFDWDSDGDGEAETYEVTFIDNGDEARSVLVFTDTRDSDRGFSVEGGYEVSELRAATDKDGNYLIASLYVGDYWSHDYLEHFAVRLHGSDFIVESMD